MKKLILLTFVFLLSVSFASALSADGQILNLHMEGDCYDSLGNYNFTNGGVTNTTGVWGGALENTDGANGKDCYYNDADFLAGLANYTFNLWIYSDKFTADENVFGKLTAGSAKWVLHIEAGPYIRAYIPGVWREPNAYPLPLNVWQMVTVVANPSGVKIILNDTLIYTDAVDGSLSATTTHIFTSSSAPSKSG